MISRWVASIRVLRDHSLTCSSVNVGAVHCGMKEIGSVFCKSCMAASLKFLKGMDLVVHAIFRRHAGFTRSLNGFCLHRARRPSSTQLCKRLVREIDEMKRGPRSDSEMLVEFFSQQACRRTVTRRREENHFCELERVDCRGDLSRCTCSASVPFQASWGWSAVIFQEDSDFQDELLRSFLVRSTGRPVYGPEERRLRVEIGPGQ